MKTLTRLTIILLITLLSPVGAYPQITGTQQQIEKLKKEKEKKEREQREAEAAARKKREAEAAAKKKRDAEAAAQRKKREAAEAERKEKERKAAIEKQRKEQQRLREENRRLREEIAHRDSVEKARLAQDKEERQEAKRKKREAEEAARTPKTFTVNGVSFTMVSVQGGTFTMGATAEQGSDAYFDEMPVHNVTLSDYMIGQTEVTQELWETVMGSNPSKSRGYNYPVSDVSWNDCQTFINRLNSMTGKHFRLPTEAEWEFAARGGNSSRGYKYSGSNDINSVAWYRVNNGDDIHSVATKRPNELGIYDMSGNVWEWCQDWRGGYSSLPQTNPKCPSSDSIRVYRGGGAWGSAGSCRVSYRGGDGPDARGNSLGLRLCL